MDKNTLLLISFFLVNSLFTSCQKEQDFLLTVHPWHGVVYEVVAEDGTLIKSIDISKVELIFKSNGKFFMYRDDKIDEKGFWYFEEGTPSKITFRQKYVDHDGVYNIEELTLENFSFYREVERRGSTYRYTSKFKR